MMYKQVKTLREERVAQLRESLQEMRKKKKEDLQKLKQSILEQRRNDVLMIREQRAKNEEAIKKAYLDVVLERRNKSYQVKISELQGAKKIHDYHDWKQENIRREKEMDLKLEEDEIMKIEKEIKKMSKKEDKLLNNVEAARMTQYQAFNEFEEIMKAPLGEVEAKYKYYIKKPSMPVRTSTASQSSTILTPKHRSASIGNVPPSEIVSLSGGLLSAKSSSARKDFVSPCNI